MKLNCDKDLLNKAINISIKAVTQKTTQPLLKCLLLSVSTGSFTITGNDLKLAIKSFNIESNIIENGSILIDAKMLSDIFNKLPSGIVSLETDEDNFMHISVGKTNFKVLGIEADEYPPIPEIEKNTPFVIPGNIFSEMIEKTIFSVATEDIKPILTGELIEKVGNRLNIVAIDGFRVSHIYYEFNNFDEDLSLVVPAKSLSDISKIVKDETENIYIYSTEKHFMVDCNNGTIVTRLLEGEFMEYEKIFTDDYTTKIILNRSELINSLERAILVAREGKRTPVKFAITNNNFIITSNTEKGNSYDELYGESDGEDITIAFNPNYIMDVLKNMKDEKINLFFTTALSPCIIKGSEDSNYRYLILPLRIKG